MFSRFFLRNLFRLKEKQRSRAPVSKRTLVFFLSYPSECTVKNRHGPFPQLYVKLNELVSAKPCCSVSRTAQLAVTSLELLCENDYIAYRSEEEWKKSVQLEFNLLMIIFLMLSTSVIKQKHRFKIQTICLLHRIFWSSTEITKCTLSVNGCIVLIRTWGFDLSVTLPCNDVLIVTWYILFWLLADCICSTLTYVCYV